MTIQLRAKLFVSYLEQKVTRLSLDGGRLLLPDLIVTDVAISWRGFGAIGQVRVLDTKGDAIGRRRVKYLPIRTVRLSGDTVTAQLRGILETIRYESCGLPEFPP